MSNHPTTTYRLVTIPEVTVTRAFEGEDPYEDTIPSVGVHIPHSANNADAIDKALRLHRKTYEIPANVTVRPTVATVPLVVGTTVESASGTARWRGRTVG